MIKSKKRREFFEKLAKGAGGIVLIKNVDEPKKKIKIHCPCGKKTIGNKVVVGRYNQGNHVTQTAMGTSTSFISGTSFHGGPYGETHTGIHPPMCDHVEFEHQGDESCIYSFRNGKPQGLISRIIKDI
ncbi:MAG: hypothetical protein ACXADH_16280 [Candidatus Kariarchaeaceae archaeon]|jgi:hypothetical protein